MSENAKRPRIFGARRQKPAQALKKTKNKKKTPPAFGAGANAAAGRAGEKTFLGFERKPLAGLFFVFLFLLSAVPVVFAQVTNAPDLVGQLFYGYWQPQERDLMKMLVMAGVGLCLSIAAIGLMYGHAIGDEMVKMWAKKEVVQAGFSVLIMLVAVILVNSLTFYMTNMPSFNPASASKGGAWQGGDEWSSYVKVSCAIPPKSPPGKEPGIYERPCHIKIAEDYLQILFIGAKYHVKDMLRQYSIMAVAGHFEKRSGGLSDPSGYLSYGPFVGLTMPVETLGFLIDVTIKNMMVISFQQDVLEFLHLAVFPLLFSLGIFLRSLFFTRRTGGLLIALALGFYLVYPLTYVFFHSVLYSMTGTHNKALAPDQMGSALFRIRTDMGGASNPVLYKPVPGAGGYNANCADVTRIYPGEQCNKPPNAVRFDTGKENDPQANPMACPPAGEPDKIYCNTNSCLCTADQDGVFGNFRTQYMTYDSSAQQMKINAGAQAYMELFNDPALSKAQTQAADDKGMEFMRLSEKNWFERTNEAWGKAVANAFMSDQMLGFNGAFDNTAKLLVFSVLAPFISLMVTLAGIKAFSPLLGGDVEIAGLTRVI